MRLHGAPLVSPDPTWTVETSRRVAAETVGLLEYFEDPTPGIAGMAAVAATAEMPLAMQAYVSALPPFGSAPSRLHDHVRRLAAGGASGLALYHFGLVPDPAPLFSSLAKAFRDDTAV